MLNPKIQDAFNKQLNAELFASYLYLSMGAYFESQSLAGMAAWMRAQSQEETMHAMKLYDFIHQRDGRVTLTAIEAPKTEWNSPLEAFEDAYKHEQKVTGMIDELVNLSLAEGDHASNSFLQWFVTEQVEEEDQVRTIIDKLKLVGDQGVALFMLDGELGQRQPAPTTTTAAE